MERSLTAGKKSVAERILYGAFESISKKGGKERPEATPPERGRTDIA